MRCNQTLRRTFFVVLLACNLVPHAMAQAARPDSTPDVPRQPQPAQSLLAPFVAPMRPDLTATCQWAARSTSIPTSTSTTARCTAKAQCFFGSYGMKPATKPFSRRFNRIFNSTTMALPQRQMCNAPSKPSVDAILLHYFARGFSHNTGAEESDA